MVSDTTYFWMTVIAWFCISTMIAIWIADIIHVWHRRPPVVWDYDQQRWRSARLVMRERDHASKRVDRPTDR